MAGTNIEIDGPDGNQITAHLALPESGRGSGVCISHDIYGPGPNHEATAALFAAHGYVALVPDMFWDLEPTTRTTPGGELQYHYLGVFNDTGCMDVMECGIAALREHDACTGEIGVIGFCAGGTFAVLSAARFDIQAAASYYGTRIHENFGELDNISCPTLLHISEHDHTYSDAVRDEILAATTDQPTMTSHIYTSPHGFAHHPTNDSERADADLAHGRTFAVFDAMSSAIRQSS